ncbi:hypothetical protein BOX15_Mlig030334g7 [Macrostomum lignano]|uniref:DUF753 domain-containing protein n=1 Tax=Macrostomum lignano TaxID=282301 RepID=A0A267DCL9_9PLAT|nr:hypothetical protein BOX15_Mlig030334g7 [Macrostomum lignano]
MDNAFVLQLCLAIALFQLPVCSAVTKCIVGAFSGTNYSTAAFDALKSAKSKTCPTTSNDKCHTVYTSASGQLKALEFKCGATACGNPTKTDCDSCDVDDCNTVNDVFNKFSSCPYYDGINQTTITTVEIYCVKTPQSCKRLDYKDGTDAKVYIGCESDCTAKETAATPANVVKGCTSCKGYDCAPTTAPAVTTPNKSKKKTDDVKDSKDDEKKSQDQLQPGQPIFLALLVAFSLCLALL